MAYETEIRQVRILIPDTDSTDYLFTDVELSDILDLYLGDVRRSAAAAIRAIASNEVLLFRAVRTDDLSVDGTKGAALLYKRADALDEQADAIDATAQEAFVVVYPNASPYPTHLRSIYGRPHLGLETYGGF